MTFILKIEEVDSTHLTQYKTRRFHSPPRPHQVSAQERKGNKGPVISLASPRKRVYLQSLCSAYNNYTDLKFHAGKITAVD